MVHEIVRAAVILANKWAISSMPRYPSEGEVQSTVLEYMLDSVWTVADEIYILFDRDPPLSLVEAMSPFGVKILVEQNANAAGAVFASLDDSRSDYILVATGDLPFLKPNVIFALFEAAKGLDAAIPRWLDGKLEPMLGVYSRKVVVKVCTLLEPSVPFAAVLDKMFAVRHVSVEDELTPLDPERHSFFRVQGEKDLEKAATLAAARSSVK